MGALGVLMAIGLFEVEGGAARKPTYQVTSPVFNCMAIRLNRHYFPGATFTIVARSNSAANVYIQSTKLNGQPLNRFWFPHTALVGGGAMELELGPQPSPDVS